MNILTKSFLIVDTDDVNDGDVAMTLTDIIIATSPLLTSSNSPQLNIFFCTIKSNI